MQPTIASDLRLTPQAKTVLTHLRNKTITPMQAIVTYGIARLASCIHEIRRAGYTVDTEIEHDERGHRFARYRMRSGIQ